MREKTPITTGGLEKIKGELDTLIKGDREEIKKRIREAREHGDLKENAEYHAAKEKQALVEGRIARLQHTLASAQVVDISRLSGEKVVFGSTVSLELLSTGEESTYKIVGEIEADSSRGYISYKGPLAQALIGKEEGDTVLVRAPKGKIEYAITSIQFIP